jgi:hypothetical protein
MLLRTRTTNSNWTAHAGACYYGFNSHSGHECLKFRHLYREENMYIEITDAIAITIALTTSITLIITTAVRNAKLTRLIRESNGK